MLEPHTPMLECDMGEPPLEKIAGGRIRVAMSHVATPDTLRSSAARSGVAAKEEPSEEMS